jgi:hypothetical protein
MNKYIFHNFGVCNNLEWENINEKPYKFDKIIVDKISTKDKYIVLYLHNEDIEHDMGLFIHIDYNASYTYTRGKLLYLIKNYKESNIEPTLLIDYLNETEKDNFYIEKLEENKYEEE